MYWICKKLSSLIEQTIIHTPCIDPDTVCFFPRFQHSLFQFAEQPEKIPAHHGSLFAPQGHRLICKTMHFLLQYLLSIKPSLDYSSAGTAEICRQHLFFCHFLSLFLPFSRLILPEVLSIKRSISSTCTVVLTFFVHSKCIPRSRSENFFFFHIMHRYRYP